jgi:hypothetical protein
LRVANEPAQLGEIGIIHRAGFHPGATVPS